MDTPLWTPAMLSCGATAVEDLILALEGLEGKGYRRKKRIENLFPVFLGDSPKFCTKGRI